MTLHDPATCEICARLRAAVEAGEITVVCNHDRLKPGDRCDLCTRVKD